MKIIVYSKGPINALDKNRIAGIIRQSQCPNESLKNTFKRFAFMQGNNIVYFDDVTVQTRNTAMMTEIEY